MYFFKELLVIFTALKLTSSSAPCADVTHSQCLYDDSHIFFETDVPTKEACQLLCMASQQQCHFSLFDAESFLRGNCRLYEIDFSNFIGECNDLSGPRDLPPDCDLEHPPDNSCQVYRQGKCNFGNVQETYHVDSWQNCHLFCRSTSRCQIWRFEKEEGLCEILYSAESSCGWEFSPREPSFYECDDTSCDIPEQQNHGDWFCPASSDPPTCHLECDPGFVSDSDTVITCYQGDWSSSPSCVSAVALITGRTYPSPSNTVEIYAEGLHRKLPDLPDPRYRHSLDLVNSFVLLCGGATPICRTSCLALSPSLSWLPHSTTTSLRFQHSSVSALGKLHLLGGHDPRLSTSGYRTQEVLTPPSDQWSISWDLHDTTQLACAVKTGPEVFMVTGGHNHPRSLLSYNVTSSVATRLQDLLTARDSHGCVYVKKAGVGMRGVLVAGGQDMDMVALRSSEMYDLATGEWAATGELTIARNMMKMVVLGEDVLAMGGRGNDYDYLLSVDRFNMTSMEWMAGENMLEKRAQHAVTGVPPHIVGISKK